MKPGDVLASLDGWPVRSPAELHVALRSAGHHGAVTMHIERQREEDAVDVSVHAAYAETEEGILYDAIER